MGNSNGNRNRNGAGAMLHLVDRTLWIVDRQALGSNKHLHLHLADLPPGRWNLHTKHHLLLHAHRWTISHAPTSFFERGVHGHA